MEQKYERPFSIIDAVRENGLFSFFYDLDLKKVEFNVLDKIILVKPHLGMLLEFVDSGIQPYRLSKIELNADIVKSLKDHGGSGKAVMTVSFTSLVSFIIFPHIRNIGRFSFLNWQMYKTVFMMQRL